MGTIIKIGTQLELFQNRILLENFGLRTGMRERRRLEIVSRPVFRASSNPSSPNSSVLCRFARIVGVDDYLALAASRPPHTIRAFNRSSTRFYLIRSFRRSTWVEPNVFSSIVGRRHGFRRSRSRQNEGAIWKFGCDSLVRQRLCAAEVNYYRLII